MASTFNPQILVEKLTKLNASQASIETLSHWCIFHMNKAKYVVETWNKQFHCSPREQRMAFLFLANDIIQNSRRKGADFVAEFWKVLPGALHYVIENGDASERKQTLRLIDIWDDRKVFGSRGHVLKDELLGRRVENSGKTGRQLSLKLNQSAGSLLDKIVSGYEGVYGDKLDEDVILSRCRNAINFVEKATKDVTGNMTSGQVDGVGVVELQHQHAVLKGCIDQLKAVEASRASLVSHLREALQEQEFKLDQVRTQLQAAQSMTDQASIKLQHSPNPNTLQLPRDDQVLKEVQSPKVSHASSAPETTGQQPSQVLYTRQAPFPERTDVMDGKAAAAAVAAKLTASTSSAQMLTFVLSSLAQEGVIGTGVKDSSSDHPPEKKHKPENSQQPPPPPPSVPQPLPPLPLMSPYPMPQYMQAVGPMSNIAYNYRPPPPIPGYTPLVPQVSSIVGHTPPPPNPYQTEGGFYTQQPALPAAPISRQ